MVKMVSEMRSTVTLWDTRGEVIYPKGYLFLSKYAVMALGDYDTILMSSFNNVLSFFLLFFISSDTRSVTVLFNCSYNILNAGVSTILKGGFPHLRSACFL